MRHTDRRTLELLQGTLDLLILQTLRWGEQHGYGISQAIRTRTNDVLRVETGSLYPALHRLEKQGLVSATWKTSENNQRAKYYRLTRPGQQRLVEEQSRWAQFVAAIATLSQPQSEED